MSDRWMIRGPEFTNCNCNYGCPCQFNSPSSHGYCEAVIAGTIEEGYFNQTSLDGLNFVVLIHWPGEIPQGNGKRQVIIDERATPDQRESLRKILFGESTKPGSTHFNVFDSTVTDACETLYSPIKIDIDIDACKASVKVPGLVESSGTPIPNPFTGGEHRASISIANGFEYTHAEIGSGVSKASGAIKLDLKNTHGQFCVLHMNQDGVIR